MSRAQSGFNSNEWMRFSHEDAQKKELREYKMRAMAQEAQAQLPLVEPVPLTIEEDLS